MGDHLFFAALVMHGRAGVSKIEYQKLFFNYNSSLANVNEFVYIVGKCSKKSNEKYKLDRNEKEDDCKNLKLFRLLLYE